MYAKLYQKIETSHFLSVDEIGVRRDVARAERVHATSGKAYEE